MIYIFDPPDVVYVIYAHPLGDIANADYVGGGADETQKSLGGRLT